MTVPVTDRLLQCFRAIFPSQSDQALTAASPDTIESWDSNNQFLLIGVIEEEFGLSIPESAGGELLSFSDFEKYLQAGTAGG